MPVMINNLLGQYVEEVKKIYGEHLKSVSLYGSYISFSSEAPGR